MTLFYDAAEGTAVGTVGIPEIILILVLALVLFGPQKLPELARNLGKAMAEFRKASAGLRGSFEEHLRELESEVREAERTATVEADASVESPAPGATTPSSSPAALPEAPQPEEKPADGNPNAV